MTYLLRILRVWALCMAWCIAWWGAAPLLYAQTNIEPFVNIVDINTRQFPRVEVTVAGVALPQSIADLPLELLENQQTQSLVSDQTAQGGLQWAALIDAKNLTALDLAGQSHQEKIARVLLSLIEQQHILRHEDRLAAYTIGAGGELQTLQDWTDEPNLIFNSFVQTTPANGATDTDLGNVLLLTLARFQDGDFPSLAKSIVLFATGSDLTNIEEIVAKANALHVRIDVVDLAGATQPDPAANALSQLAARTQGQYLATQSGAPVDTLGIALTAMRNRRIVAYQSTATAPAPIEVRLQLPTGVLLANSTSMALLRDNQAPANTSALTETTSSVASSAQTSEQGAVQTTPTDNQIAIPGTAIFFPRPIVMAALGLLLLLLAYLLYSEIRDRRATQGQAPINGLSSDAMLPKKREEANPASYSAEGMATDDAFLDSIESAMQEDAPLFEQAYWDTPSVSQVAKNGHQKNGFSSGNKPSYPQLDARPGNDAVANYADEKLDDDGVTFAPPEDGDDDATYRFSELKPPLLGSLIRETDEQSLPAELPIYKINCIGDEARYIYIGRHSKHSSLVIKSKYISREHAILVQRGNRLYIRDNGSTAGTFVNGQKLEPDKELLLRNNDRIDFGIVAYIFRAVDPVAPPPYEIPDKRADPALVHSPTAEHVRHRRARTV